MENRSEKWMKLLKVIVTITFHFWNCYQPPNPKASVLVFVVEVFFFFLSENEGEIQNTKKWQVEECNSRKITFSPAQHSFLVFVFIAYRVIGLGKLFMKELNAGWCSCIICPFLPMFSLLGFKMQLASLRQGYFLTVSQLPLPWVMALRDSLSDSDEVMSEPRTKLSLLCPTEALSLLASYALGLFFSFFFYRILCSSTLHCHFIHLHAMADRIHNTEFRLVKNSKRKQSITSLLGVIEPMCVIHPAACSTWNSLIYTVPL